VIRFEDVNDSKPLDVVAGEPAQPRRDAETPSSDLIAERDAARQAQALAELRASQYEIERDSAFAAQESLRLVVAHLMSERAYLAGQLKRTYERPWRPVKFATTRRLLRILSAASQPISGRMSARFARSAESRSPSRFDRYFAPPGAPARKPLNLGPVLIAENKRPLRSADVGDVRLPISDHPIASVIIPTFGKP
jgi:hypothetical protein